MKQLFSQPTHLFLILAATAAAAAGQTKLAVTTPVTFGQTAALTATVTGGATPTGLVSFYDNTAFLGTATLATQKAGVATATYSTKLLAPLTHSIVAVYYGDTNNNASTSLPQSLSVVTLGANAFQAATGSPIQVGKPFGLASGDFNGDGAVDLAVANGSSPNVTILLGDPNNPGQFLPAATACSGCSTPGILPTDGLANWIAVGDFNGSGHQGLAVACANGWIDVFTGQGNGQFTLSDSWNMATALLTLPYNADSASAVQVLAADFTNDGITDLIVVSQVDEQVVGLEHEFYGAVVTFQGNGDGTFGQFLPYSGSGSIVFLPNNNPWMSAVGDFNGDGNTDIAIPDRSANSITILLGEGTGAFPNAITLSPSALNAPDFIAAADLNGDGVLDLAVANSGSASSSLLVMLGDSSNLKGNSSIAFGTPVAFATGSGASGLAIGDFNGDGFPDIAVTNFTSSTVSIMLNDAAAPGTAFIPLGGTFPNILDPAYAVIADFNGDGRPDLAVTNDSASAGSVSLGLGAFPKVTGVLVNNASATSVIAGMQPLTVELDGVNISAGSSVVWEIANNPTATLAAATVDPSGNFLTVTVPAAQVAAAGTGTLTILDPSGVSSNSVAFSVAPLAPALTSLSVSSEPAAITQAPSVTLTGTGFAAGDKVYWQASVCNTPPCPLQLLSGITINSSSQITFSIPTNLLTTPDPAVAISVVDSFGHSSTNTLAFQVVNPSISSITSNSTPFTSVGVDSGNIPIVVTGADFVAGVSQIVWTNPCATGTPHTLVSAATATQITATLSASNIGSATGAACITVQNNSHSTSSAQQVLVASPVIASMNPPSASVGGNLSISATITGADFVAGSQAFWCNNCAPPTPSSTPPLCSASPSAALCSLATSVVSSTQLGVTIPGGSNGLLQGVGAPTIIVNNAGATYTPSSAALSNGLTFPISTVIISSLNPTTVLAGSPQQTLTINGQGFESNAVVLLNGTSYSPTSAATSTQISVNLPASLLAAANTITVAVLNPSDGSQSPNAQPPLTVGQLAVTGYTPTPLIAGSPAFTMGITGSYFNSGVQVHWVNGSTTTNLNTTYSDASDLSAIVPANLVASAGTSFLTVSSVANGVTIASSPFPVVILGPSINTNGLSPSSASVGGPSFILDIQGLNFLNGATAQWATGAGTATALPTIYLSPSELNAVVPANLVATQGIAEVTITNPSPSGSAGATSNGVLFSVGPSPTIGTVGGLSPTSAAAGSAQSLTLTLTGTNYAPGSVVQWSNGGAVTSLPTSFQSSTTLSATVAPGLLSAPGTVLVSVVNSGGATSNSALFTIGTGPTPTITGFSPTTATAGGALFQLTVNGTNFNSGAQAMWNPGAAAQPLVTIFVNSTQLTAVVPASLILTPASVSVTVVDAGGGTSAPAQFTIAPAPSPTISSFSPASAQANGSNFTLTVDGANFVNGSVVQWNGGAGLQAIPTLFVSSVQLSALVPGNLVTSGGVVFINVVNPGSVSGPATSYTVTSLPVTPTISTNGLSPASAVAGGVDFLLMVTGTDFSSGTVAQWDGSNLPTTVLSSTQLAVQVSHTLIATQSTHFVGVLSSSNLLSNLVPFIVGPGATPTIAPGGLNPATVAAGSGTFQLAVTGTNFVSGSQLLWGTGVSQETIATAVLSSTQLSVSIPGTLAATAASIPVAVQNPDGTTSNAAILQVLGPQAPTILTTGGLNPSSVPAATGSFQLLVAGANFVGGTNGSTVQWNNGSGAQSLTTTFISGTQLSALVPANDISTSSTVFVSVVNPGNLTSNVLPFVIGNAPQPAISAGGIGPSSVSAGSAAFTLTVTGSNFVNGSVIQWAGVSLTPTTYLSSSQLTAMVPQSDLTNTSTVQITVLNPAGGGLSNAEPFTITAGTVQAPQINVNSGLTQFTAVAGSAAFTLGISGANFTSSSAAVWLTGGVATPLTTAYLSSSQLSALVPASLLANAGPAYVEVQNAAGVVSNLVALTVTAVPAPVISTNGGLSPSNATSGAGFLVITVTGSNFQPGAVVTWNAGSGTQTLVTGFTSSAQLSALAPSTLLLPGAALIQVQNPDNQVSNALTFTITGATPTPTISANGLSPSSAIAGGVDFLLTITGTGFGFAAVAQWDGSSLPTTVLSSTQVAAQVSHTLIATQGTHFVGVLSSSLLSNLAVFAVGAGATPTIAPGGLSPSTVAAGSGAFQLTINGTNYLGGSQVLLGSGSSQQTVAATVLSSTQLSVSIGASLVAGPASIAVAVQNPDGSVSNASILQALGPQTPTILTTGGLSPTGAQAATGGFQLLVTGTNFVGGTNGSTVQWNNGSGAQSLATTFIGSTQLSAQVPGNDISTPSTAFVSVLNPGSLTSNVLPFVIGTAPQPTLSAGGIAPASVAAGTGSFTLTVTGANFVNGSVIEWAGVSLAPTTFLSSSQLSAVVPQSDIATTGTIQIAVLNPAGGGLSNSEPFTITTAAVQAPQINANSGLTQVTAVAGSAAFTLGITGSNFIPSSVVQWLAGGVSTPLTTAYLSPTQLSALVPTTVLANAGPAYIDVQNASGVISNLVAFNVSTVPVPTISVNGGLSPSTIAAGASTLQLTVTGSGFQSGAVLTWNSGAGAQTLLTGFIGDTQLTALVPPSLLVQPGVALVQVQNPDKQTSNAATFQITGLSPSAVPTVTSIAPATAAAGSAGLQISVVGTNFSAGVGGSGASTVQWNGVAIPTTYMSATQLSASVNSTLIASPGNNYVNVANSASTQSIGAQFLVAGPSITALSPANATAGGPSFNLTVTGANFVNGSVITWNGSPAPTTFSSSTQLTGQISAQFAAAVGTANILVTNPGGAGSNPQILTLSALVPTLTSLSPAFAAAGGSAFELVVSGSNFETGSAVLWNGVQLPTTVMSATQLNAIVDSPLLATAGTAIVVIQNPGPSTSASIRFSINGPTLSSVCLAATSASTTCVSTYPALGSNSTGAGIQLTITGQNFLPGSAVQWNGAGLPTLYSSATQLTAYVAASYLASQGGVNITVQNPGGAVSSPALFVVGPFTLTITTSQLPDAVVGLNYVNPSTGPYLLTASGGTPPYSWAVSSGALPQGMTLAAGTGALSGVPTTAGSAALSFTVTDSSQRTASAIFSMRVVAPLTIATNATLPLTFANAQASIPFAAAGGTLPYKWSVSGNIPAGLAIDPASGLLTGISTNPGSYQFSVSVTDSGSNGGQSASGIFNLEIAVPNLTLSGLAATSQPATQPNIAVSIGSPYSTALTGVLTLTFASSVGVDDPIVAFSTGGRTVAFTIPAGATTATFGQEPTLAVLTGTDAGTITITASIQAGGVDVTPTTPPQLVTQIGKQAPVITSLSLAPVTGGVKVTISGYSTTRDITQASFTFNPAAGSSLTSSTQTANLASTFNSWYAGSGSAAFGSQFTIAVPFAISGDVSAIGSVTATISNSIGASAPVSANMQ